MSPVDILNENLKFLVSEIQKQVEETLNKIEEPVSDKSNKVASRESYINYLRNLINRKAFQFSLNIPTDDKITANRFLVFTSIANNLEKIGDYLINIMKQNDFYEDKSFIKKFNYRDYFKEINGALNRITTSLFNSNIQSAIKICKSEIALDDLCNSHFKMIKEHLSYGGKNTGDLLTTLFIFRYLERTGDALLNIGESVISAIVGTNIKINEYMAMKDVLFSDDFDFDIQNIGGETRSGCRIDKLTKINPNQEEQNEVVFKEGEKTKLLEEKEKLELWNQMFPALVPKIISYQETENHAVLLTEFVYGKNFQTIMLNSDSLTLENSILKVLDTINLVWTQTKKEEPISANFTHQLNKRLLDVLQIHPEFKQKSKSLGGLQKQTLSDMLAEAEILEKDLQSPFSVFIHGDLNNDNFIFDIENDMLYFIDVHRSKYFDYVQDASVFVVSNFRMPIFDEHIRHRINIVIKKFFEFFELFAQKNNDTTFHARMAFGLVRSFITSTRFTLKNQLSKEMYKRAVYLLEKLLEHKGKPWEQFELNKEIFIY